MTKGHLESLVAGLAGTDENAVEATHYDEDDEYATGTLSDGTEWEAYWDSSQPGPGLTHVSVGGKTVFST